MFFQEQAGQQHGDRRIERRDHNRFVEAPGLAGADKKYGAHRVDAACDHATAPPSRRDVEKFPVYQDDQTGNDQSAGPGKRRDPEGWGVTSLAYAKIETREANARQHRESDAVRPDSIFRARDQPKSDGGEGEAEKRNPAGQAFGKHRKKNRDRGAENGGDRRGQSHSPRRKRAIEDSQSRSTGD